MEKKRILIAGYFDLLSIAHMRMLKKLRDDQNNWIVVGVHSDADAEAQHILTVMTEKERSENLRHSKYVDEVIFPCPSELTQAFMQTHNIHAVGSQNCSEKYSQVSDIFFEVPHEEGVCTGEIISRVLNEYDEYSERTFKRDYAYTEIGLTEVEAKCLFLRLGKNRILSK